MRTIRLNRGFNELAYKDVSAKIRPETAMLQNTNNTPTIQVLEQNFDFDLLTPAKLLEKYLGKKVTIIKRHPTSGEESSKSATVLSVVNGVVLKIDDRIETGIPDRIAFPNVPSNLRDKPTLVMHLNSSTNEEQKVELSYLTAGLSWKADYVAEINEKEKHVNLTGWVTLTNKSGTPYNNAKLQLVAGDVNTIPDQRYKYPAAARKVLRSRSMARNQTMKEEDLFEYHLYTLNRKTTLSNYQTKQVSLLTADAIPVHKELILTGQENFYMNRMDKLGKILKVAVYIKFTNDDNSKLGKPLPKGIVRVYKSDLAGSPQFIGEDQIDHTPRKGEVALKLGESFDVTAKKVQTNFEQKRGDSQYDYFYKAAFMIELKNAKDIGQEVIVRELIPGDWSIEKSSHKHLKAAAHTAEWKLKVPKNGKTVLTYSVRVRH